jgi:hypothetical protein
VSGYRPAAFDVHNVDPDADVEEAAGAAGSKKTATSKARRHSVTGFDDGGEYYACNGNVGVADVPTLYEYIWGALWMLVTDEDCAT